MMLFKFHLSEGNFYQGAFLCLMKEMKEGVFFITKIRLFRSKKRVKMFRVIFSFITWSLTFIAMATTCFVVPDNIIICVKFHISGMFLLRNIEKSDFHKS